AALWYWYPRWIPRRFPSGRSKSREPVRRSLRSRPRWRWRLRWRWPDWLRWRRPQLRWPQLRWPQLRWPRVRLPWRRRRKRDREKVPELLEPLPSDELPELPVEAFVSLADRLAAEGRFAEALRERLRAIVRDLVDHGVIEHRPGWTITELAATASRA